MDAERVDLGIPGINLGSILGAFWEPSDPWVAPRNTRAGFSDTFVTFVVCLLEGLFFDALFERFWGPLKVQKVLKTM